MIEIIEERIIDFDIEFDFKCRELENRKQGIKKIIFKTCRKCGEKKPIFNFAKDKRSKLGRSGICNICNSRECSKYYYLNRDKKLKQAKEYGNNHKAQKSLYHKNYRKDHKENLKEMAGKYYRRNRKAIKAKSIKYYKEVILNNG